MERVLPGAEIKTRISALAVGYAADCDAPEGGVEDVMRENLPGATGLPFVALVTHDGTWIDGFSGFRDGPALLEVLTRAEKSPLLDATDAVRKQLEKLASNAVKAADKGDWKTVLTAGKDAAKSSGRCPERTTVKEAVAKAREWANTQLTSAVVDASSGGDLAPIRKNLAEVRRHFTGEPEAADAEIGAKAITRLHQIREAEANPNPARDLRDKAAVMFKDSRWAAIFTKPPAPAEDKQPK